jgi:N-acetylmuramic acid 6-phosphate (MurNAc-6-P) etherase
MSRELLEEASQRLRDAAEATDGDVQQRIYDQSDALASLAASGRTPDHGRLARHMNTLAELAEATDGTAHEAVVAARETVSEFREGVEGV